jgi:signal transduction histidine kinase
MLFVLCALWFIAALLLLLDYRSMVMRWMSAVAFTGGCGALAAVFSNNFIPYIDGQFANQAAHNLLYRIQVISSLASYYCLPYSYAMLALHYNPSVLFGRLRKHLPYLLLLPPIACLLFTPGYNEVYPVTFSIVALWAVPYFVGGSLLIASKKERLPGMQRTHLYTCLALLPPILSLAILSYVLPSFGYLRMWIYNAWIIAVVVPFFIFVFFKYGFLGIRLFIERRKLDSTLRAITSGTAILNHAIKNDVGKMRLFVDKMKRYAEETNQPELLQDLQVIQTASEHIREMIGRVHEQTQDIALQQSIVSVEAMVSDVLLQVKPYLAQISTQITLPENFMLRCDPAQVKESLTNLIMNAIDAMPQGGELILKSFATKKHVVLEIKDTGIGLDKSVVKQVLEPFFTTKSGNRNNFGLGLAYCYNVMKKHGGALELRSEKGKGTSVFLSFPAASAVTTDL